MAVKDNSMDNSMGKVTAGKFTPIRTVANVNFSSQYGQQGYGFV